MKKCYVTREQPAGSRGGALYTLHIAKLTFRAIESDNLATVIDNAIRLDDDCTDLLLNVLAVPREDFEAAARQILAQPDVVESRCVLYKIECSGVREYFLAIVKTMLGVEDFVSLLLAQRLSELRQAAGISQFDLAVAAGVNVATLQKLEYVDNSIIGARISSLLPVCRVLGIGIDDLLDLSTFPYDCIPETYRPRPRPHL